MASYLFLRVMAVLAEAVARRPTNPSWGIDQTRQAPGPACDRQSSMWPKWPLWKSWIAWRISASLFITKGP
ncbi:hypothetical protein Pres01_43460 [Metapseudomonas resinovorans]|nr:hypothetical protein Pres01_43460 [Pseudomonas resinovorans]